MIHISTSVLVAKDGSVHVLGLVLRGMGYLARLRRHGVPLLAGYHVSRAEGDESVAAVTLARLDARGRPKNGTERHFAVDALCLGYGLQPSNELARSLGCRHEISAPGLTVPVRDSSMSRSLS